MKTKVKLTASLTFYEWELLTKEAFSASKVGNGGWQPLSMFLCATKTL